MDLNKKLRCAIEFNILSYMTHQLLSVGNCVAALDELYLFLDVYKRQVLTWKRTSQNSYDTLKDDARVFTYGLELTKLFSDGKGDFSKVQFIMQNKTCLLYTSLSGGNAGGEAKKQRQGENQGDHFGKLFH